MKNRIRGRVTDRMRFLPSPCRISWPFMMGQQKESDSFYQRDFRWFTAKNIRTSFGHVKKSQRELQLVQDTISTTKCSFRLVRVLESDSALHQEPGHGQPLSVSNLAIFSLELSAPPCIPETVLSERSQIWA